MNKTLLIILIAVVVVLGVLIAYMLKLEPAVALVDGAKTKLAELTGGNIDLQTAVSGVSIASAGASIAGLANQLQQKKAAVTSAINQSGLKDKALEQVNQLTETKEQLLQTKDALTSQVDEITKIKDDALKEAEAAKTELATTKDQLNTQIKQTEALGQMNTNTIQNLWKNSGGDWWTDPATGEKYKLLSLVTEKVI